MPKISLVINTKNEEAFIEDCILSAKNIVDEIVVVDMHSTDKTVEIAKGLGAVIFYFDDCSYVEPARNFAIQKASNQWVLLLDADERLTPQLSQLLATIAGENKYDSVKIPRKNIHFGKWTKHTGWWPDHQLRFFQRSKVNWGSQIHNVPEFPDNYFTIPAKEDLSILHYNFRSIDQLVAKITEYTRHENNLTLEKVAQAENFINYFEGEFNNRFFLEKGYKDGFHGFMLSKFMEFYRFLEVARLWEKNNYQEITDVERLKEIKVGPNPLLANEN
ncbi:MAG: glycosyl transferase family protein [Flaviaesturariibacter sp.]|nr:glycosyl transferase family protein [Flaviaesturariibacter sp.]